MFPSDMVTSCCVRSKIAYTTRFHNSPLLIFLKSAEAKWFENIRSVAIRLWSWNFCSVGTWNPGLCCRQHVHTKKEKKDAHSMHARVCGWAQGLLRGVRFSTSVFPPCHQRWSAGSSLVRAANFSIYDMAFCSARRWGFSTGTPVNGFNEKTQIFKEMRFQLFSEINCCAVSRHHVAELFYTWFVCSPVASWASVLETQRGSVSRF